jgi:GxxExxY protein
MPITCQASIRVLTLEDFKRLDHEVMRHAFDSQNELGRLCEEAVYQADLAARLRANGLTETHTRVGVRVSHADFAKPYYVDLLADHGLYELKAVPAFSDRHRAQLIHFLGGPDWVKQRVPLFRGTVHLGDQTMNIHSRGSGFVVTAFTTELAVHETNLRKLLALSPLHTLQWINLKHALVQFTTLTR